MLSLRDTGKIQENNASILHLGELCGLIPPFSLKDFILKDCIVDVTHLKLCVVLLMWSPPNTPQPVFNQKSNSWYANYFLNWGNPNGIASYWYKESFGRLKIEGKVLGWFLNQQDPKAVLNKNPDGSLTNNISRYKALDMAKQLVIDNNESLDSYDAFIAVVGVNQQYAVLGDNDGGNGSTFAIGTDHNHTCHEVGHIIGNNNGMFIHSFGLEKKELRGGVYGYPYCIMSAEWYGGVYNELFTPKMALELEEMNRGPGLCGGTRVLLGWAKSIDFNLDDEKEGEFEIQSLGSNHPNAQAIIIRKGGKTFFVEYRSSKDENDQIISKLGFDAVVVVGIITGGIAAGEKDGHHKSNGTFINQIPLNFGSSSNVIINFEPNWGIMVIGVCSSLKITIRIVKNFAFSLRTFRRTHDIIFLDGSSSFQIDGSSDYEAKCDLYDNLSKWRINGQPLKSLRSLVNL